ncbi:MAG: threonine--tRNA ligase, partial [Bdellovibrio sp.]
KNPMLQRVYATAFRSSKELKEYLNQLEEAKKRDHRKLGKEMGLFHFHEWAPGSPFFTGKGSVIYNELQAFLREKYFLHGYKEVITPQIYDVELFQTSGHAANYAESMYFTKAEEKDFGLKPMNCPGHCLLFGADWHSYRDLPLRMADFGRLHRFEKSGTMHGLSRVRSFCQDDAHVFCSLQQMPSEIEAFMRLLAEVYRDLGMLEYKVYLSTRPSRRLGSEQVWDQAEGALKTALENLKIPYEINAGDGAFYGPKLDIMFVDAIRRPWQLGTLQVDFNMPERFQLKYSGEDNQEHRPVMLHRAILGSLERFISVYLEHTSGHLPLWLSPVQVRLLNVTDRASEACQRILQELKTHRIRAEFDARNEKLNYKIREAQLQKIPQMWILGDQEVAAGSVSIRHSSGRVENGLPLSKALDQLLKSIQEKIWNDHKGDNLAENTH